MKVTILYDGKPITLRPRSDRILRFLLTEQESIESIPFGKLTLSFAGRKVQPELSRSYRPIPDDRSE
jgi:hypothetical protein